MLADITVVSWQAHDGEPVLDTFWTACFGADVAITASLHGGLCFWSITQEAASKQRNVRVCKADLLTILPAPVTIAIRKCCKLYGGVPFAFQSRQSMQNSAICLVDV